MRIVLDGFTAYEYWRCASMDDAVPLVHGSTPQLTIFDSTSSAEISEGIRRQPGKLGGIDVLVGSNAERRNSEFVNCGIWSARVPLPPKSIYEIGAGIYVESPELCLLRLAFLMDRLTFLRALSDMLGIYGLSFSNRQYIFQREPLTTIDSVRAFLEQVKGARGARQLRKGLGWVVERSGSPRETTMNLCMSMPSRIGGQQLPRFEANYDYSLSDTARLLTQKGLLIGDAAWPEMKTNIEYNSSKYHDSEKTLVFDFEKITTLQHMGVTVIPVSTRQFNDYNVFATIMSTVRERLGVSTATSESIELRRAETHERLLAIERSQRELPHLGETARWQYLGPRLGV